ncbi:MAG: hypothetical protein WAN03_10695 [Candidatus Sulfotelmatobacter sp.]
MKNVISTLSLVVMSLLLNAALVNAQTAKANVPFAFSIGATQLPAGTYTIVSDGGDSNAIIVRNLATGESAMSLAASQESAEPTTSKLVFHHVGAEYFLAEVWRVSGTDGKTLPTTKRERELTKELQLAKDAGRRGQVIVALK